MDVHNSSIDDKNKTLTLEEKEQLEKQSKIQELQEIALKNPTRKISHESMRGVQRRWQKYTDSYMITRFLKSNSTVENGSETTRNRNRSKSVFNPPSNQFTDQKLSSHQRPKLPGVLVNGRLRSATVGCTVDLQRSVASRDFNYEVRNDSEMIKKSNHKSDLSIDFEQFEERSVLHDEANHKDNEEGVDWELGNILSNTVDGCTQSLGKSVSSGERVDVSSQESQQDTNNGYLWKRRVRNVSRLGPDEPSDLHVTTKTDQSLPTVTNVEDKVKTFMGKSQPSASPQSLKLPKNKFDANFKQTNKSSERLPRIRVATTTTSMSQLNSQLYLNPFRRPDGKSWYYNDKSGKCRYLRVPPTPVLTVEEIFHNDTADE